MLNIVLRLQYLIIELAIIFVSLIMVFSSCSKEKTKEDKGDKIYYFPISEIPEVLDPAKISTHEADSIIGEIFDGLVYLDESFEVKPEIAESWEYDDKTATYIFHLRDNIYFHDNTKLTAYDVEYSFQRLADPDISEGNYDWIFLIEGAKEYKDGKKAQINGLRVIDEKTIEIELVKRFTPFLKILTKTGFSIVSKTSFERFDKGEETNFKPIGSGPFMFKQKTSDGSLYLEANTNYYRHEPLLKGIIYKKIDNPRAMLEEYQRGNLHHIWITEAILNDILAENQIEGEFCSYPINKIYYFAFNLDSRQFGGAEDKESKRLVRQAINFAIDREYLCKDILKGYGVSLNFIFPFNLVGDEKILTNTLSYEYDKSKARELLEKAGYGRGKEFKIITIHTRNNKLDEEIAKAISKDLNDIGLKSEISLEEDIAYENLKEQKWAFFSDFWVMEYPDIYDYLSLFLGKNARGGKNKANLTRDYIDELIYSLERLTDKEQIKECLSEIEKELWYDSPYLMLFQYKGLLMINNDVVGLKEQLCQLDFSESLAHVRMEDVDLKLENEGKKK